MKETMEDELVFCNADNISTDGIYHGRHMYEDLSPARMAEVLGSRLLHRWVVLLAAQ